MKVFVVNTIHKLFKLQWKRVKTTSEDFCHKRFSFIFVSIGLRISPEQWSSLLYGDPQHKSSMQSIIDKLSTPAAFSQAIQEFLIVLQRAGDSSKYLSPLKSEFEQLAQIDLSNDQQTEDEFWSNIVSVLKSVKIVLESLVDFNAQHLRTNSSNKTSHHHHHHNFYHHHHHHRPYDPSSTTMTSSTSCSSPMTVSPIGGSSTTSEYQIQPLPPPPPSSSLNNQTKYKVR